MTHNQLIQHRPGKGSEVDVFVAVPLSFIVPGVQPDRAVHPLARPDFTWPEYVRVRRLGDDTSHCVAALGSTLGIGVPESQRFLAGAAQRQERALGIWEVGGGTPLGFM